MYCQLSDPLIHLANLSHRYVDSDIIVKPEPCVKQLPSFMPNFYQIGQPDFPTVQELCADSSTTTVEEFLDQTQTTADLSSSPKSLISAFENYQQNSTKSLSEYIPKGASLDSISPMKQKRVKQESKRSPNNLQMDKTVENWCGHCKKLIDTFSGNCFVFVNSCPWHVECLACSVCEENLQWESTCFVKGGLIYCKKHYQTLFHCTRCEQRFCRNDIVFEVLGQARFHERCFSCAECQKPLRHGDKYHYFEREVFCQGHFLMDTRKKLHDNSKRKPRVSKKGLVKLDSVSIKQPENNCGLQSSPNEISITNESSFGECTSKVPRNSEERFQQITNLISFEPISESSRLSMLPSPDDHHLSTKVDTIRSHTENPTITVDPPIDSIKPDFDDEISSPTFGQTATQTQATTKEVTGKSSRQKRIRTSFKHQQLRIMKSFFDSNHNPDAKDLRLLSQRTCLPKRVLQVWFQNARAKYRRAYAGGPGQPGLSSDSGVGCGGSIPECDEESFHSSNVPMSPYGDNDASAYQMQLTNQINVFSHDDMANPNDPLEEEDEEYDEIDNCYNSQIFI